MMTSITKAILISGSQEFTGSIVKIQAIHGETNIISGGNSGSFSSLARIEYGNQEGHSLIGNSYTASAVLDFQSGGTPYPHFSIPAGHTIEGPINRLKSTGSVDSKWLIYYK